MLVIHVIYYFYSKMIKVILDTDPGVDDAIALMLLAKSPNINLQSITTVAGNSTIENTTANAQYLKKLLDLKCPIYTGARKALKGPFTNAHVHGITGLAGIDNHEIPILTNNAPQKIVEIVTTNPHEITIVCIGPETNLAQAILLEPNLPSLIKEIVIMGGSIISPGNQTAVAEFNIGLDPEAAEIIFESPTPKVLVPLDVCYQTPLFPHDISKLKKSSLYKTIKAITTPYIKALKQFEGQEGAVVYDALAAFYLINPNAFKTENYEIHIETAGKYSRGALVVDRRSWGEKHPNVSVVTNLNRQLFLDGFIKTLTS